MLRSFGKGPERQGFGCAMFRLRFARDTLNGVAAKEAGDYVCAQSGRRALRRRLKGGTLS